MILTSKKLYPKITIVYLNISEVSDYILSDCYRGRCNHIILKLHSHFNAISLGCCFNVIDSRLSDSMYSFIRHLKRVQMLMVFHTCIHFICCYFALFFRVFTTKVVYILEVIFFSTREWVLRARFCKNKILRLLIHCIMHTISFGQYTNDMLENFERLKVCGFFFF